MAATFSLKGGMASEGQREEGAKSRSPGRVVRSCQTLTVPLRGSWVSWARGACREPSSLGGDAHCTHVPISAPWWSVPPRSAAGHEQGPPVPGEELSVGAVGLTPMGGRLSGET